MAADGITATVMAGTITAKGKDFTQQKIKKGRDITRPFHYFIV